MSNSDPAVPPVVKGCPLPADRLYDIPNHVWYAPLDDGSVRMGMSIIAIALASFRIFAVSPRRVGRRLEAGRAAATIESSKWVGPARIAFDGTVVSVNAALIERPGLLAEDPYGAGWMLIARPDHPEALAGLTSGAAIAPAYAAWMAAHDFPGCSA